MHKVLTIAGSDPCGGAGIQADLKTFMAHGVYGASALTAVTAQNTQALDGALAIPAKFVSLQIDTIMTDIGADVWKTGMLVNEKIITVVSEKARLYKVKHLVVDPVMVSKTGKRLLTKQGEAALIKHLLPLAYVLTPNTDEAEALTGITIRHVADMKKAAVFLRNMGPTHVVIKGGHLKKQNCVDILFTGKRFYKFTSSRILTENTHGGGCTFAASIAAQLAKGSSMYEAVRIAKEYVAEAIQRGAAVRIGKGHGPVIHPCSCS